MRASEFLFPSDLQVSATALRRVLFIGSCLSEAYVSKFKELSPETEFEHILFNNVANLPEKNSNELSEYNLVYIQIPLRSVLTDAVVSTPYLNDDNFMRNLAEESKKRLDAMLDSAMTYNVQTGILTLVSSFLIPQVRVISSLDMAFSEGDLSSLAQDLNRHLASRIKEFSNAFIADVESIASSLGKRYFLDDSLVFYSHNSVFYPDWAGHEMYPAWTFPERGRIEDIPPIPDFYEARADEFFEAVLRQIVSIYRTVNRIDAVKMVVFDLDNTLWRGQIAEHYNNPANRPYIDGWPLGVWETVQQLRARGIIVSIASKNDRELVERKWEHIVDPPFVRLTDFFEPQIGWAPKAESIAKLLEMANVLPNSVVFVDDHPVEREAVKSALPGVRAIGGNPFLTRRILLWSPETQVPKLTSESRRRQDMLVSQVKRDTSRKAMSREEFLASLDCKIEIIGVDNPSHRSFDRCWELINKTNQFNTTGERRSVAQLAEFLAQSGRMVAFEASDKYTAYGLVGIGLVKGDTIEQFVMSCRVLGMEVEVAFVGHLVSLIRGGDPRPVTAKLIHTEANTPCRHVYLQSGFVTTEGGFLLERGVDAKKVDHVKII